MADNLWDLSETGADEQRVLSQKEREFLMTGDSGSYTNAEMERRVSQKVSKLPDRVQQLIDDVSLLYHGGHLSTEDVEVWGNLLTIKNRSQKVRDAPVVRTRKQIPGDETELGFEIGTLIRMIHEDSVPTGLVWGIIVGLIGESDKEWQREAGNIVELFEELNEYYEWRLVSAGARFHEGDGFEEERDEIRGVLQDHGFAPAPPLVNGVLEEYTKSGSSDRFEKPEKSWKADPSQTDHPTPPGEVPSNAEMRQTSFENIISQFADQTPLSVIDRVAKDLREDAFQIQKHEWRGVDADPILQHVGKNGVTQTKQFEQRRKGKSNIGAALNRLSADDSSWVNRPVLQESKGDNSYWKLTAYGELLYKVRVENNCSTNWIYNYVVTPEEFDEEDATLISESVQLTN